MFLGVKRCPLPKAEKHDGLVQRRMVFCDAPPHTTILLYTCTETQAHMEATSFVICIHVSLHCRSMFKPHLIKRWLPCFLYSHMLPIRSRQTGSLPEVLHSHVQREQDTLRSPLKSTISNHRVFSEAICRALLDRVRFCH